MPLLLKYDYSSLFSFECNASTFSVFSWEYSSGEITLKVDYETDLEEQEARFAFYFNHLFVEVDPIVMYLMIESDGLPLIV